MIIKHKIRQQSYNVISACRPTNAQNKQSKLLRGLVIGPHRQSSNWRELQQAHRPKYRLPTPGEVPGLPHYILCIPCLEKSTSPIKECMMQAHCIKY